MDTDQFLKVAAMKRILRVLFCIWMSCICLVLQAQSSYVFSLIDATKGLSDNQVRCIIQLPDGRMAITTHGNVNFYDGVSIQSPYRTQEHLYHLEGYGRYYRLYLSSDTLLWIKDGKRLMLIDLRQNTYLKNAEIEELFHSYGLRDSIYDFYVDSLQRIYTLTNQGELWIKEPGDQSAKLFLKKASYPAQEYDPIYDLQSVGNSLYIFYRSGLMVCYDLQNMRELYRNDALEGERKENYSRVAVSAVSSSGIYIIYNGADAQESPQSILCRYDFASHCWSKLHKAIDWFHSVTVTPSGQVWVGAGKGIWTLRDDEEELTYLPALTLVDGVSYRMPHAMIYGDRQGGIWVASDFKGVFYYHPDRFKLKQISARLFPGVDPNTMSVDVIAEKGDGKFYIRSWDTFYEYDSGTDRITLIHPTAEQAKRIDPESPFQAWGGTVRFTDSRGWKWWGAWCGLSMQNPQTGEERIFYKEDGLGNNAIRAIVEDHDHTIWVSTCNGLSHITPSEDGVQFKIVSYNCLDGAIPGEYARWSALVASDGRLFFGGFGGFNIVDKKRLMASHAPLAPVFTDFYLQGVRVHPRVAYNGNIILPQTPSYTHKIVLNHDQNFITLCFSALNFVNPLESHYRFRLKGVDTEWQEYTGADGLLRASYTKLSPGEYIFQVYAAGNDKVFDGPCVELEVKVRAPFWATPLAYILYVVFTAGLVFWILKRYQYSVKQKLDRKHKEDMLLLRIKHLLEECDRYEDQLQQGVIQPAGEQENDSSGENEENGESTETLSAGESPESNKFLTEVIRLIETNLQNTDYSVEQLSHDLYMDRTGLYRKLTTLIDKSPNVFIRSIRLQRATQLLAEAQLSISEIAYRTGFSSPGYFTRCFQKEYGMRPSDYVEQKKRNL